MYIIYIYIYTYIYIYIYIYMYVCMYIYISIRYISRNITCYNKIFWSLQHFPNSFNVMFKARFC